MNKISHKTGVSLSRTVLGMIEEATAFYIQIATIMIVVANTKVDWFSW